MPEEFRLRRPVQPIVVPLEIDAVQAIFAPRFDDVTMNKHRHDEQHGEDQEPGEEECQVGEKCGGWHVQCFQRAGLRDRALYRRDEAIRE